MLYSVFVSPSSFAKIFVYVFFPTEPLCYSLPLSISHFSSIWCVNCTSEDYLYIFNIFSDIKMSLKVQLHNGHKPISNHAAAKRGNNFASHLLSCTALVILWQYSEPDLPVSASERWSAQKVRENSAAQPSPPPPFCQHVQELWFEHSATKAFFCSLDLTLTTSKCLCGGVLGCTGELSHLNNSSGRIQEKVFVWQLNMLKCSLWYRHQLEPALAAGRARKSYRAQTVCR